MALDVTKGGVKGRRPSLKGTVYSRVSRGVEISQAWPRERGRNLHPKTKAQMEYFRQVQWAYKFSDALVQIAYQQAVKGTPLMPRDLFLMASSGRMHRVIDDQGRSWWSVPAILNVSDSLDVIAQLPGQMLIRRADRWGPLPGGEAGQILTSNGPTDVPAWQTPVAPPSGVAWGSITGDITAQVDLVDMLDAAAATAAWGGIAGTLSDQADLEGRLTTIDTSVAAAAATANWGSIAGTLADQVDLAAQQAAQDVATASAALTAAWGSIGGAIAAQADLTAALNALAASIAARAVLAGGNAFVGNQGITGDLAVTGTISMGGFPFFNSLAGPATTYEVGAAIPRIAQFTVQNGGTGAQFIDTTYGCKLVRTAAAGAQESFAQFLTAPNAATFTLSTRIVPADATYGPGICATVVLRNSTSGRITHFGPYDGGRQLVIQNLTSYAAFSSNVAGPWGIDMALFPWKRVVRNGNALSFWCSCDGDQWELVVATTVSAFLTATGGTLDQIGFGLYSQGASLCQNFNLQNIAPPGYSPNPWYGNGGA